ncbi:MAG: C-terminal binding protein [Actinobacteria bacterium]|nr:C-terminal binding protein [Actinomycetota bacterium]
MKNKLEKEFIVFNSDVSLTPIREVDKKRLAAVNAKFIGNDCLTEEDFINYACDADIIYNGGHVFISKKVIKNLPKLKAIVRHGMGYDNIDIKAAKELGIVVSNCPGFCIEEVSTHCIALLLSFLRSIPYTNNWVKEGNWFLGNFPQIGLDSIFNEIVGIIGFGNIGKRIYQKLLPFKPKIYIFDPYFNTNTGNYKFESVSLIKLLKISKYIVLACSQTEKNYHMLDEKQFSYMRKDAVIINVARGKLINEKVLIKYLEENKIGGAALDVFENEPISPDSPLLKLNNVILTPHTAGTSPKALELVKKMVIDEIIRIIKGEKPLNQVN